MLSKVISGRALERVMPATFAPAHTPGPQSSPPPHPGDDASPSEAELQALRDQIRQLQAELIAAKRDSFDAGRHQGEQQARSEIAPVIERMNASIAELTGLRSEMRHRAEKDAVQLALLIARRILHRELNVDPNALTALARVVFERLTRSESYKVIVHPSFAPAITAALPGNQASRVRIEPDPACAIGSLIVQSVEGLVDASIDSQLEEIGRGLTDRLAHSGLAK